MASRICFLSTPENKKVFSELEIEFKYYNGFAISQKQKSIQSMHEGIKRYDPSLNVLEVSTKSPNALGKQLSAFNLRYYDPLREKEYPIENIFQSAKVFQQGGPYLDLLDVHPKEAKRDERLKTSGEMVCFELNKQRWELEPKSLFYDWIYINSLHRNKKLSEKIIDYNAFTDIEFNHQKSFNCQARSAAIYVSMCKKGIIEEALSDKSVFLSLYGVETIHSLKGEVLKTDNKQISLDDL